MTRRKTKDELFAEAHGNGGDDDRERDADSDRSDLPQPESGDTPSITEAITETEREEANELFDLLNSNGYGTLGNYSIQYVEEFDHKVVSFSVVLPSSTDWDPSVAYRDHEQDDE